MAKLDALFRKMDDLKGNVERLKDQVGELIAKVSEAKEIGMAEFKELKTYRLTLKTVVAQYLCKERVKIKRLL